MRFITKKKIFVGLPLALISIELYLGVILGYFIMKYLSGKKAGQRGKFAVNIFNFGDWRIHLHHWFYCSTFLVAAAIFNFSLPFPQLSYGLLGGFIAQGIFSYPDWYKVVVRKRNNNQSCF